MPAWAAEAPTPDQELRVWVPRGQGRSISMRPRAGRGTDCAGAVAVQAIVSAAGTVMAWPARHLGHVHHDGAGARAEHEGADGGAWAGHGRRGRPSVGHAGWRTRAPRLLPRWRRSRRASPYDLHARRMGAAYAARGARPADHGCRDGRPPALLASWPLLGPARAWRGSLAGRWAQAPGIVTIQVVEIPLDPRERRWPSLTLTWAATSSAGRTTRTTCSSPRRG